MGCQATKSGISLQFCNACGNVDGAPIYGKYAALFGTDRSKILAATGPLQADDDPGSDDWLTVIAVADSDEKLEAIIKESAGSCPVPETSGSSRRARVEVHIGALRQSFQDRITIASGPIISIKPPKLDVVHVKVLPPETKMDEKHQLFPEWKGMSLVLLSE